MTRLRLWIVILIWTSAPIGRRLRTNMPSPGRAACDADHSLQNDSERFRTFRLGRQREIAQREASGRSFNLQFQAALRPV
jgi:hypothetical protein